MQFSALFLQADILSCNCAFVHIKIEGSHFSSISYELSYELTIFKVQFNVLFLSML